MATEIFKEHSFEALKGFLTLLEDLPRSNKRLLVFSFDASALCVAMLLSILMRQGAGFSLDTPLLVILILTPLIGIALLALSGVYRTVVRHLGHEVIVDIIKSISLTTIFLICFSFMARYDNISRTIFLNFWFIALFTITGGRLSARYLFTNYLHHKRYARKSVIIYGAGKAGTSLQIALLKGINYKPVAFIDDDKSIQKLYIGGLKVYKPRDIQYLIKEYDIKEILLAMPASSGNRRRDVLSKLADFPVAIKTVPSLSQMIAGTAKVDEIKELEIEDLLGRSPVPPVENLLTKNISEKSVLVTGAGGSIGSELCRQIARLQPRRLVAIELNEFALYQIEMELKELAPKLEIISILADCKNRPLISSTLRKYNIQTVYHAAAYKHVPLVQANICAGIENNVIGTHSVALAAIENSVENFVLISTDKAVRPTSIMGASKRVAEMILQDLSLELDKTGGASTIFSMVRFGNVLGSSGSVVPRFRKQIAAGGPVTVTHPDIIRYFMTIPEAAQLVIQAGAMAQGGDVFVLDMGEPVKIKDLAEQMIKLSGYSVAQSKEDEGIEITYTGLRPAEKLYEELLIEENAEGTQHSKILKAQDKLSSEIDMSEQVSTIASYIINSEEEKASRSIMRLAGVSLKGEAKIYKIKQA